MSDKGRVGRPRTRIGGETSYVGFRAPKELKDRLQDEARRNGRSISTETQFRIEQSFRDDRIEAALNEIKARLGNGRDQA